MGPLYDVKVLLIGSMHLEQVLHEGHTRHEKRLGSGEVWRWAGSGFWMQIQSEGEVRLMPRGWGWMVRTKKKSRLGCVSM